MANFTKDPDALLDYKFNWQDWLNTGDTIIEATAFPGGSYTNPGDIRVAANSVSASVSHVVWLSAGNVGEEYIITSRITTAQGRRNDQSLTVSIEEL